MSIIICIAIIQPLSLVAMFLAGIAMEYTRRMFSPAAQAIKRLESLGLFNSHCLDRYVSIDV
jgi:hypothetical protein